MAEGTPPPIRAIPTAKERKYDRQLRLWAASGQAALEDAHILLLNCGSGVTGVETLKNLVLPGIGQFTIQDSDMVVEADLGVNFFLEYGDLGRMRAERTVHWLAELNPDVLGHAITDPIETFLQRPDALSPYTFIILAHPATPEVHSAVTRHASDNNIPLFHIYCTGFYGALATHLPPAFPIVDTHPDPATTTDLRLLEPWPELTALAEKHTAQLDSLDAEDHGHVPWVLLLLHYLKQWRDAHDGAPPSNYKEKSAFRELVRNAARSDGPEGFEENYEEAVKAVLKTLNPHAPSPAVTAVFNAPECQDVSAASPSFWLIAHAAAALYADARALPLAGAVPDMKAKSADYIALQDVYKSKARADVADVAVRVRSLEARLRRQPPVPDAEIAAFCRAAASVRLLRGRAPPSAASPRFNDPAALLALAPVAGDALPLYLTLLGWDAVAARDPAAIAGDAGAAIADAASELADALASQAGDADGEALAALKATATTLAAEAARARGAELHNVAAVLGGVAAQEAIKVVTAQYVPVENVVVFDGVGCVTGAFLA